MSKILLGFLLLLLLIVVVGPRLLVFLFAWLF